VIPGGPTVGVRRRRELPYPPESCQFTRISRVHNFPFCPALGLLRHRKPLKSLQAKGLRVSRQLFVISRSSVQSRPPAPMKHQKQFAYAGWAVILIFAWQRWVY
jgi:hypothetical protein